MNFRLSPGDCQFLGSIQSCGAALCFFNLITKFVSSSIFVPGAEREENLIGNDPDKSEFTQILVSFCENCYCLSAIQVKRLFCFDVSQVILFDILSLSQGDLSLLICSLTGLISVSHLSLSKSLSVKKKKSLSLLSQRCLK